jgi:hypothetical protein
VILGSLAAALVLRKNTRLRPYWRLAFAYFVASCAIVLSDYTGDWALTLSGQALNTAKGFTALKLGEDAQRLASRVEGGKRENWQRSVGTASSVLPMFSLDVGASRPQSPLPNYA